MVTLRCPVCSKPFKVEWRYRKSRVWCTEPCAQVGRRKVKRPTLAQLLDMTERSSIQKIAEMYGVSRKTIRNWIAKAGGSILPWTERKKLKEKRELEDHLHRKSEARRAYHKCEEEEEI